jgi:hypothetical protein
MIFTKQSGSLWNGLIYIVIWTNGRLLWTWLPPFIWVLTGRTQRFDLQPNAPFPSTFTLPCIVIKFFLNNQPDAIIIQIYSVIKFYMFRASSLSTIRINLDNYCVWFVI